MDKKNTFIGAIFVIAAIGLMVWNSSIESERAAQRAAARPKTAVSAPVTPSGDAAENDTARRISAPAVSPENPQNLSASEAKIVVLENDTLRVNLTTRGGAIHDVALLQQADTLENRRDPQNHPYIFNDGGILPALALSVENGTVASLQEFAPEFSVVQNDAGKRVVLEARLSDGGVILRSYEFSEDEGADPHIIAFKTTFRAPADAALPARFFRVNTGTLPPSEGDPTNQFLGIGTYDGDSFEKTKVDALNSSGGFLGFNAHAAAPFEQRFRGENAWQWISVTNHFFAGIIRFDEASRPAVSNLVVRPSLTKIDEKTRLPKVLAATGDIGIAVPALAAGQEFTVNGTYYIGPREYTRLANLGGGQEKAVQFARLFVVISMDFLCKVFVVVLNGLHSLLPAGAWSWGFAIILLTVIIKAITWPLVTTQQRSAERMRQFQGPMKAIREKYKDDLKRQQQEMMKLYQEHKINPFAGCLPVLIQIPIFTGLFFTFQSLAQLRFQSFLWIPDLAMPDVIPGLETIAGFPIHILPVFMGVTMLFNMRMTPMPNVEGQQKIIFYGMMVLFPVICYAMPAALMLYYSVQNCLTIVQTFVTRRRMRNEGALEMAPAAPEKKRKKK